MGNASWWRQPERRCVLSGLEKSGWQFVGVGLVFGVWCLVFGVWCLVLNNPHIFSGKTSILYKLRFGSSSNHTTPHHTTPHHTTPHHTTPHHTTPHHTTPHHTECNPCHLKHFLSKPWASEISISWSSHCLSRPSQSSSTTNKGFLESC